MPASGLLRYPYEAITQNTDYLQIRIFKYERKDSKDVKSGPKSYASTAALDVSNYVSNKAKVLGPDGVIILPMPSNIQDSNVVSYDSDSMNTFAAQGVSVVQELMKGAGTSLGDAASGRAKFPRDANPDPNVNKNTAYNKALQELGNLINNESVRGAATAKAAVSAVNLFGANVSFNSLLARTQGKILNPNMELLFNNVTLRTFRFSFKFAPRDPNEATAVKSIIRTFKKNMAAQVAKDNIFLQTPNIFKLTYRKGNQNHPFLHRFKDCALSDMSVQYTGDNVYATYSDGTPISMIMNLTFKELMPIYSSDYEGSDDGYDENGKPIGFDDSQLIYGAESSSSKNVEGVGF